MDNNLLLRIEDLVNNPTPRVPICLCLDTSGSMGVVEGEYVATGETVYEDGRTWNVVTGGTSRIDELQKGVEQFYEAIREDEKPGQGRLNVLVFETLHNSFGLSAVFSQNCSMSMHLLYNKDIPVIPCKLNGFVSTNMG